MWTVGHFWRGSQGLRGCWVERDREEWWQLAEDPGPPPSPPPPPPLISSPFSFSLLPLFPSSPYSVSSVPPLAALWISLFFPSESGILECQRPEARIVLRETGLSQSCSCLETWRLWGKKLISRPYLVPGFRSDALLLLFHWIVSITLGKLSVLAFLVRQSGLTDRNHDAHLPCLPPRGARNAGARFSRLWVSCTRKGLHWVSAKGFLQNSYGWLQWALGRKWALAHQTFSVQIHLGKNWVKRSKLRKSLECMFFS